MACAHASPSIHGWTAHLHRCDPTPQPCMACAHTSPSMHGWTAHLHRCDPTPPSMHGLLARVSIHAWLDRTCASMRAHHQPCMACAHASPSMHGWTAHLHQCEPIPQPCMACSRASPSIHGWTAHMHQCAPASSHAWLDGSHLSSHTWLEGAHTSVRGRLQPCMARLRASSSIHGWTAHMHQAHMHGSTARISLAMHGWKVRTHQCEPNSSHAWPARARLHPYMAGRRLCISVRPPLAMHA
jgi:hypothetical protein